MATKRVRKTGVLVLRAVALLALAVAALGSPTIIRAAPIRCYVNAYADPPGDGLGWPSAYSDLQSALKNASCGEVWVAAAVYYPTNVSTDRNATFVIPPGVKVYGGFVGGEGDLKDRDVQHNFAVLSGDIDHDDTTNTHGVVTTYFNIHAINTNSLHVVTITGPATSTTVLDGLTITAGYATTSYGGGLVCDGSGTHSPCSPSFTNVTFSGNYAGYSGGGLLNNGESGTSSPALNNVTFQGNGAGSNGGGVDDDGWQGTSSPSLNNVLFDDNHAGSGGAMYNWGGSGGTSSPTLQQVTFNMNGATTNNGGAIYNRTDGGQASPTLYDVAFTGNTANASGGAMYNEATSSGQSNPHLERVTFSDNSAGGSGSGGYGGAIYNNVGASGTSSPWIINATFYNNTAATSGGAIYNNGYGGTSSPTLTNVTLSGNHATTNWGGAMLSNGNSGSSLPQLTNVIAWGDTAGIAATAELYNVSATPSIDHSVLQGGCLGGSTCTNLVTTDPRLGPLANNGGYTQTMELLPGSSALNKGLDTACPWIDQRGVGRPQGTHCDIGAYEAQPPHVFADVPVATKEWMEPWIEAFYNAGVTTGCGQNPQVFCPENNVTRAEMAVFLLRAKHGQGYAPPPLSHFFNDVPVATKEWMEPWIDEFYREGITGGCGTNPLVYCPENQVTRAEMAVFVLRSTHAAGWAPPPATGIFGDVPVLNKEWMQPWIEEFYHEGITSGCGTAPLRYCPENQTTRAEMAVFIGRAYSLYP